MNVVEDTKLDFSDVLLMPKRSSLESRSQVSVTRQFTFKHSSVPYNGTPIIVANMDHPGTMQMARALGDYGIAVALHKFYSADELVDYFTSPSANPHTFYSMGIRDADLAKFYEVSSRMREAAGGLRYICVDVANGYSRRFVKFVEQLRGETSAVIMAGNVVTPDAVYDLLERGVDIVKIGIGPGSVCTTRKLTGVGYPQLSAIMECQDAAHQVDGHICGDGGLVVPGDFAKGFAAGADFLMAGGIFAGHEECSGGVITKFDDLTNVPPELLPLAGKRFMRYYGMSSTAAMDKHYGGKAAYRASEGKIVDVPFKGPVSATADEILGGIRSAMTYIGARRLKDMAKCATFIKVNRLLNDSLSKYDA